jgi:hypothetical protein
MKRSLLVAATCIAAAVSAPALAADVGVSVSVGQPGFYGHIDIGDFPPPAVIYQQPVLVQQVPVGMAAQPMYLRVPPGHYKHWDKHCAQYGACGRPVYFVRDSWYNNVYVPQYRQRYEHDHDRHDGGDRGEWRDHDDDRGHGHGNNGKGHGHGKGHGD